MSWSLMRKLMARSGALPGAALLLAAAVGLGLATPARTAEPAPALELTFALLDTLVLPVDGRVTGLTWMGGDTLAVLTEIPDSLSESGDREVRLVVRDSLGAVVQFEDFTGVLDRGLAWDGESLWSCGDADDGSSILYRIEPDTLKVEDAFNTPGHRPTALCWDGSHLWISDRDSGRLDRFDPEVKEITRSVVAPGFSPFGVLWDGRTLWVTDSGTGRLYRLSGGRLRWTATVSPESFLYRGQDVLLLHDGESFWFVPPGQALAVRVRFE